MDEDIKPCPFCGEPGKIVMHGNLYSIECSDCQASVGRIYWRLEDAIEDWNMRNGNESNID